MIYLFYASDVNEKIYVNCICKLQQQRNVILKSSQGFSFLLRWHKPTTAYLTLRLQGKTGQNAARQRFLDNHVDGCIVAV